MSTGAHLAPGAGHETRDVRIRPIVLAFVGLGIVALIVHVVTYFMLAGFTALDERRSLPASPLAATEGRKAPPEPRLQISPRDVWEQYARAVTQQLRPTLPVLP